MKKLLNWFKLQITIGVVRQLPNSILILDHKTRVVKQYNMGCFWVNYGELHHIQKITDGLNEQVYLDGKEV